MTTIAKRAQELLGTAVVATTPVAGGDICTATRLRLSTGGSALMKTRPHAPADFFPAEARGLRWLGAPGAVDVPEVLAAEDDCLIIGWVDSTRPSLEAADELGRSLARTHAAGAPAFGADSDGYIGTLPMPNRTAGTWPEFYVTRRVLPYLKLARDREAVSEADSAAIDAVLHRVVDLAGPEEPPARLHGDLWSGNVMWGSDGRAWLIDPAAYGGHRETDLAMMSLFGLPQLPRVLDAYQEVRPLAAGWEDRVGLHQLFPLLVHACLFDGGYGHRAAQAVAHLR